MQLYAIKSRSYFSGVAKYLIRRDFILAVGADRHRQLRCVGRRVDRNDLQVVKQFVVKITREHQAERVGDLTAELNGFAIVESPVSSCFEKRYGIQSVVVMDLIAVRKHPLTSSLITCHRYSHWKRTPQK